MSADAALSSPVAARRRSLLGAARGGAGARASEAPRPAAAPSSSAPRRVVFRFNEPVEAAFGAVRVFDARRARRPRRAEHPDGRGARRGQLSGGLGDGTYTATYRVVSADSHPVAGGFVFTVGSGGAPAEALDQLIDAGDAGTATEVGFGIVRGLSYLAIALAVGGLAFCWPCGARRCATRRRRGDVAWAERGVRCAAPRPAADRRRSALGAVATALGIVFQGATAGGHLVLDRARPEVVRDVLSTRFGTVWGLRARRLRSWPSRSLAARGGPAPARWRTGRAASGAPLVAVRWRLLGFLCLTPALAGHASTQSPTWLLVPANSCTSAHGGLGRRPGDAPAGAAGRHARAGARPIAPACWRPPVERFSPVALLAVAASWRAARCRRSPSSNRSATCWTPPSAARS